MLPRILIIVFFSFAFSIHAQIDDVVKYSPDFVFREGIYLTYEDFTNNRPIQLTDIVSMTENGEADIHAHLTNKVSFTYKDSSGTSHKGSSRKIWGFCDEQIIYINFNADFNRLPKLASLCHFTAMVPRSAGYHDFMYAGNAETEQEYILDTETGKILAYTPKMLEPIFKRDKKIYEEYKLIDKKQRQDAIFRFMTLYNDTHPLYFPAD